MCQNGTRVFSVICPQKRQACSVSLRPARTCTAVTLRHTTARAPSARSTCVYIIFYIMGLRARAQNPQPPVFFFLRSCREPGIDYIQSLKTKRSFRHGRGSRTTHPDNATQPSRSCKPFSISTLKPAFCLPRNTLLLCGENYNYCTALHVNHAGRQTP